MLVANDGLGVGPGLSSECWRARGWIDQRAADHRRAHTPFIATLGTLSAITGVAFLITNGEPISARLRSTLSAMVTSGRFGSDRDHGDRGRGGDIRPCAHYPRP